MIFLRHGRSVANDLRRFSGRIDVALSREGEEQAACVADYLCRREHLDNIYTSGLYRTRMTALPVAERMGIVPIVEPGLIEIDAGLWENLPYEEIAERFPDDWQNWRFDPPRCRCTGGESIAELFDRVCKTVKHLGEANDGKCILLVTHATPLRVIDAMGAGDGCETLGAHISPANASLHVYHYENGVLTPEETDIGVCPDHLPDSTKRPTYPPKKGL